MCSGGVQTHKAKKGNKKKKKKHHHKKKAGIPARKWKLVSPQNPHKQSIEVVSACVSLAW
jgi:hypothetical protein